MDNVVYVLINEAMPGYVKVGITNNLERRIRSLDTTSVPLPFECFYACTVNDSAKVERQILDAFMDHRIRSSREFFEIAPDRVVAILKLVEIENVTPKKDFVESQEDQQALNQARTKRDRFNFSMVRIPVNAELIFSTDINKKATVADNQSIVYNGERMSLSKAASMILGVDYPVSGPAYWTFEGESLDERRRRFDQGIGFVG